MEQACRDGLRIRQANVPNAKASKLKVFEGTPGEIMLSSNSLPQSQRYPFVIGWIVICCWPKLGGPCGQQGQSCTKHLFAKPFPRSAQLSRSRCVLIPQISCFNRMCICGCICVYICIYETSSSSLPAVTQQMCLASLICRSEETRSCPASLNRSLHCVANNLKPFAAYSMEFL